MRLRRRHIGRNRPHWSNRWILNGIFVRKTGIERARASHGRFVFRTQHHLVNRTMWTRPKRESRCVKKVAFHLLASSPNSLLSARGSSRERQHWENQTSPAEPVPGFADATAFSVSWWLIFNHSDELPPAAILATLRLMTVIGKLCARGTLEVQIEKLRRLQRVGVFAQSRMAAPATRLSGV
jgi:hypothetical protein